MDYSAGDDATYYYLKLLLLEHDMLKASVWRTPSSTSSSLRPVTFKV